MTKKNKRENIEVVKAEYALQGYKKGYDEGWKAGSIKGYMIGWTESFIKCDKED